MQQRIARDFRYGEPEAAPSADAKLQKSIEDFGTAVTEQAKRWVETIAAFTGRPREVLTADIGRELMIVAGSMCGNAIGIKDPAVGLVPVLNCLESYKRLAADRLQTVAGRRRASR